MKLLLVIDVADDVAKNYKEFTVNYDLRGDYGEWDESVKYVEYAKVKPLPQEREFNTLANILPIMVDGNSFVLGWNACLEEIMGDSE